MSEVAETKWPWGVDSSQKNYRFIIRDGAKELALNLASRALGPLAEQLLGKDTLVWLDGLDIAEVTHKR